MHGHGLPLSGSSLIPTVNASIYANGVDFLTEKFSISAQAARTGQMIFLICYAFGCELWAPWSEELGRRWTLQASLFLVNSEFTLTEQRELGGRVVLNAS